MPVLHNLQDLLEGKKTRSHAGPTAAALLSGAAVGVAAGVLLAPKSGRETRAHLKLKARAGLDKAKHKGTEAKNAAKLKANETTESTKQAIEEGKQAVKETKERSETNRKG